MKILVTGGAGYIGCHAVRELLDAGHQVRVLDNLHMGRGIGLMPVAGRPNVEVQIGDIRDRAAVRRAVAGADKVVHLAAIVGEPACDRDENLARDVNIGGTRVVLEETIAAGVRHFHFMSTASSYGVQDERVLADEKTPTRPVSFYAESKLLMETEILDACDRTGGRTYCTIFRPSTVHGISTRMRFDLVVNVLTKNCFQKGQITIKGGDHWRPIFWVGDAGRAIRAVVEAGEERVRNQIFNCGNNTENYQIKSIGQMVARNFEDIAVHHQERGSDDRSYKVDFTKIEEVLGYRTSRTVDECVRDMKMALETGIIADPDDPRFYNHRYDQE